MNIDSYFRGNIFRCTSLKVEHDFVDVCKLFRGIEIKTDHTSKLIKFRAVLIKLDNGFFVDIENLNNPLDYLKLYRDCLIVNSQLYSYGLIKPCSGLLLSCSPEEEGALFIDSSSLIPYFDNNQTKKNIPICRVKKQIQSR